MVLITKQVVFFTYIILFRVLIAGFSKNFDSAKPISCLLTNLCKTKAIAFMVYNYKCVKDYISFGEYCRDTLMQRTSTHVCKVATSKCLPLNSNDAFNVQTNCESIWENMIISSLCLLTPPSIIYSQSHSLLSLLVTSNTSNLTYQNYYCGVYDNDEGNIHSWQGEMKRKVERHDWENILDFTKWKDYDSGLRYFTMNNVNFKDNSPNDTELLYKQISDKIRMHNYEMSSLILSEDNGSGVAPVKRRNREKLMCGKSLHKFQRNRDCVKAVKSCANDQDLKLMSLFCQIYVFLVYNRYDKVVYKNPHCAMCNNVPLKSLRCYNGFGLYAPYLLSISMRVPYFHSKIISSFSCDKGKKISQSFSSCKSNLLQLSNENHKNAICLDENRLMLFNNYTKIGIIGGIVDQSISKSKRRFVRETNDLSCNGSWVLVSNKNFIRSNKTIISPSSGNQKVVVIRYKEYGEKYLVCIKELNLPDTLSWISFAGFVLSACSLSLYLLIFFLVKDQHNLVGKNRASLALCLLTAIIIFLVSPSISPNTAMCYMSACLMYFCFFAYFCWMNIIAFDTWDSFRKVTSRLYLRRGKQKKRFLLYSLYSWSLALIAVISLVVTDQSRPDGLSSNLYPGLGRGICWFGNNISLLVFFVAPSFVFILLNIFFFVSTTWYILKNPSLPEENVVSLDRNLFKVYARLAVLMSSTWVSGIIAYFVDEDITWFIFTMFTSLQGTLILVAFTSNKKVWCEFLRILSCSPKIPQKPCNNVRVTEESENHQPYHTPRIELLHTSSFIDALHQPSRLV